MSGKSCIFSYDSFKFKRLPERKMNDRLFEILLVFLYRTVVSHQCLRGKKGFVLIFFVTNQLKNLVLKKKKKKTVPRLARKPTGGR
jgi:hypothetical protein